MEWIENWLSSLWQNESSWKEGSGSPRRVQVSVGLDGKEGQWFSLFLLLLPPPHSGGLCDKATALRCRPGFLPSSELPVLCCLRVAMQFRRWRISFLWKTLLLSGWDPAGLPGWLISSLLFLCGLGLYLMLLPCFQSNPFLAPPRKHRNIRKVRNLWLNPSRDYLFFSYSYFHFSKPSRETPEMGTLRKV